MCIMISAYTKGAKSDASASWNARMISIWPNILISEAAINRKRSAARGLTQTNGKVGVNINKAPSNWYDMITSGGSVVLKSLVENK